MKTGRERERERERDEGLAVSTDCMDDSCVTESDGVDSSAFIVENGIEVSGEEYMGVCGEVGCWVNSRWDSQMENAWKLERGGTSVEKKINGEAECHSHDLIGEERDRPGVVENYDQRDKM